MKVGDVKTVIVTSKVNPSGYPLVVRKVRNYFTRKPSWHYRVLSDAGDCLCTCWSMAEFRGWLKATGRTVKQEGI